MTTYSIQITNGHILIENNGELLLVDTGCGQSFHKDGMLSLFGERIPVQKAFYHIDAAYVSRKVGAPVDGFLGLDVLSRQSMAIDIENKKITFGCDLDGWISVPSNGRGFVNFDLDVNGNPLRMLLDTGAPTSYIMKEYTQGLTPFEYRKDFSPLLGGEDDTFTAPVFELPCTFAGKNFSLPLGNLPDKIAAQLAGVGADGAVGIDFLNLFKVLISDGQVYVRK